jgi:hypothetical protein
MAYAEQKTDEPMPIDRPDNLYRAAPGNYGAHGRFDACARANSWHLWLTTHRPASLILGLTLLVLACIAGRAFMAL